MEEKRCSKCNKLKKITEFHSDKRTVGGLCVHCKTCIKEYNKKRIAKNIELRNRQDFEPPTEIRCNRCGIVKGIDEFYKDKTTKSGFHTQCKICDGKRINKDRYIEYQGEYRKKNKDRIVKYAKQYYSDNRDKLLKQREYYYKSNKKLVDEKRKQYNKRRRDDIKIWVHQYYEKNKEKICLLGAKRRKGSAKYKLFFDKLTIDELPKLSDDNISLEVLCRYCGKYFIPSQSDTQKRVNALNGDAEGDQYLYCSENCKQACPVYSQKKFPKGFKKASSREVNSLIRQMCFKRDNWECQICGKSIDEVQLHCHHIEGYTQNPRLGNDIDNVVTLCKECHKEVHKLPGCNYHELRCEAKGGE